MPRDILYMVWDEITYSFPNFNAGLESALKIDRNSSIPGLDMVVPANTGPNITYLSKRCRRPTWNDIEDSKLATNAGHRSNVELPIEIERHIMSLQIYNMPRQ